MKREIEFRAWHEPLKEFVRPCKYLNFVDGEINATNCIVEQFTGLKDFFETKIFEGDIVFLDSQMRNYEIVWDIAAWKMKYKDQFDNECYEWLCDYYEDLHVIGNIHQNPDLMDVAQ